VFLNPSRAPDPGVRPDTAKRRGVSPIIATVIIIAITVGVGLIVAAWLYEDIEGQTRVAGIQVTAEIVRASGAAQFEATIRNVGSVPVNVTGVSVTHEPVAGGGPVVIMPGGGGFALALVAPQPAWDPGPAVNIPVGGGIPWKPCGGAPVGDISDDGSTLSATVSGGLVLNPGELASVCLATDDPGVAGQVWVGGRTYIVTVSYAIPGSGKPLTKTAVVQG